MARIAEVRYFFRATVSSVDRTLAMVSMFSQPDPHFIEISTKSLYVFRYHGDKALSVIDAKSILSVVSLPPFPLKPEEIAEDNAAEKYKNLFYLGEKPGMDIMHYARADDIVGDEEDDEF